MSEFKPVKAILWLLGEIAAIGLTLTLDIFDVSYRYLICLILVVVLSVTVLLIIMSKSHKRRYLCLAIFIIFISVMGFVLFPKLGDLQYNWHYINFILSSINQEPGDNFSVIKNLADLNDDKFQYMVAKCYENGEGTEKDLLQAAHYYDLAANQQNQEASYCLAELVMSNYITFINQYDVISLYLCAAEKGSADAQYKLARIYQEGTLINEDNDLALFWYEKAATNHHDRALYELGNIYSRKGDEIAIQYYVEASENGNAAASFELGCHYYYSNKELAKIYFERTLGLWKSSDDNAILTESQYDLANLYIDDNISIDKAVFLLNCASEDNYIPASLMLGDMYLNGNLVEESEIKAFEYYTKASDNGSDEAKFLLAYNELSEGFSNDDQYLSLLIESARKGNSKARCVLGFYKNYEDFFYSIDADKIPIEYIDNLPIDFNQLLIDFSKIPIDSLSSFKTFVNILSLCSEEFPYCKYVYGRLKNLGFVGEYDTGEKDGRELIQDSYKDGIVDAMLYLGNDDINRYTLEDSINYNLQALKNGGSRAETNIGFLYFLKGNYDIAAQWYEKTANKGDLEAQISLAGILEILGNEKDAMKWYSEAAKNGNSFAKYKLSNSYTKERPNFSLDRLEIDSIQKIHMYTRHNDIKYVIVVIPKNDGLCTYALIVNAYVPDIYNKVKLDFPDIEA